MSNPTTITYHCGDVRDVMATMPDGSVDLLVTSPPFLALRSYLPDGHPDKDREIGSEATPAAFLDTMLGLSAEWRRLVASYGSICVEIGDTYSGAGGYGSPDSANPAYGADRFVERWEGRAAKRFKRKDDGWPEAKSLCGIPTLYTWSLAYGRNLLTGTPSPAGQWRIRNLLTWTRPNPPVGALGDKFRPATSFVTVACLSDKRWFDLDAVRTERPHLAVTAGGNMDPRNKRGDDWRRGHKPESGGVVNPAGAPPLDWWDANDLDPDQLEQHWQPLHRLTTQPYKGSHYAAYPIALPARLIAAMCPAEVCGECGEPRRRVVADRSAFSRQPELAAHIRDRREALGVTSGEINARLGYKEIAKNWERTDKHGAAIPNPDDWAVIKPWLGLSDEFDDLVLGERRWTESTVEYSDLGSIRRDRAERIHESPRPAFNSAVRHAPDTWTDCGHGHYRPGTVLDPFGGSGTTAIAAAQHGRNATLVDLDHRNVDLTRQRIRDHLHIVDETVDGDTVTWTVTAPLPAQRRQVAGQTSIFDLDGEGAA